VRFDGKRLSQARQLRGHRKAELAGLVGVTPGAITQYESDIARPRGETLARIALALSLPVSFFEGGRPQCVFTEDSFHFRRLRTSRKVDRARVLAQTSLVAELVEYLGELVDLPRAQIEAMGDGSPLETDLIERIAADARERWHLGVGPISNVVTLLETQGCIVSRLRTSVESVDAFSGWFGPRPYVVLSSDKNDTARSRFDAAHELGHLLIHPDPDPANATHEREAHRFASAFLLPAAQIVQELPRGLDWRSYIDLKFRWRVSLQALLRRARDVSVLSPEVYKRAVAQISQRGWRRLEPGDIGAPEEPTVVPSAIRVVEREYGVSRLALTERLRLPLSEFEVLFGEPNPEGWLRVVPGAARTG
jgi:Zn-dependent peptidase ImmA (M78 family)/DNA-binding XRE family transcriptional regulator